MCTCVLYSCMFCSLPHFDSREQARRTNLGRLMEAYGPKLLGDSYKDPITSFHLFHKFFVQHPQASSNTNTPLPF